MSRTTAPRQRGGARPTSPRAGSKRSGGSRPVPSLGGEVRDSALLFALALAVTVGAATVARALAGLAP